MCVPPQVLKARLWGEAQDSYSATTLALQFMCVQIFLERVVILDNLFVEVPVAASYLSYAAHMIFKPFTAGVQVRSQCTGEV